jgi:hypothetical protein
MSQTPSVCERTCFCKLPKHQAKFIVVTGGPGAGKTAILETAKKNFCQHTAILPEAASIVFGGGFWRLKTATAQEAAQRAIFHVQKEMENLVIDDGRWALGLCDRGSLDGLAYWPGEEERYWRETGAGKAIELLRYEAVIHLRTPSAEQGYNFQNQLRIETAEEARVIDGRIEKIWSAHPRYVQIPSSANFLDKAKAAIELIEHYVPECCRLPQ